ncbi:MAG: TrbC/VirB2 family protein [Alphaproteobacteria bacterium]|nr:TrbC/VirB2 family protein [Alphaproteobacteria bacterium]MBU1516583.1 TrbC/VirB2 family protein [Alphaproteobacteria bacterium]MBU2094340.1 TrbC/VirB2 family protein [Alphaproteobacteria bacterium]MBU2153224.1 TrbC/VirB2 family protein [Alphaproteobacteria bacterium]MBU2307510.1 TrbC/VirB2 family protein [Alphaproteobacteria bacterium]
MTSSQRAARHVALAAAFTLFASPALAQAAGGGGDLTGFLQNIVDLMNSGIARLLAVIAVGITGIVWMFGQIDLRRAGTVVIGIIVAFGATTIVNMITGGSGA